MKKFFLLFLLIPAIVEAQPRDLKAEVNQTVFNKIIASVKYPFTVVEHRESFPGFLQSYPEASDILTEPDDDKNYSLEEIKSLFKWAVEGASVDWIGTKPEGDVFKTALKDAWDELKKEIEAMTLNTDVNTSSSGDYTIADLKRWKGYNVEKLIDELQQLENKKGRKGFEIKAHLAYARVDLLESPRIIVNSPSFHIGNINVRPTATGELWIKMPHLRCCPPRVDWRWKRAASITVSILFNAATSIGFSIEGLKIFGTAQFTRLVLDYPILRNINLAGIINRRLLGRKFELYDASKFVASIPYIDKNFRISEIFLPATSGAVVIEINVTQTQ